MIKRNFKARLIAVILLCCSLVLSVPIDIIAAEYKKDETVNVITQDSFQELFAGNARDIEEMYVDSVRYNRCIIRGFER